MGKENLNLFRLSYAKQTYAAENKLRWGRCF